MRGNARERGKKESDRGAKENTHMHTSEGERESGKNSIGRKELLMYVYFVCARNKKYTPRNGAKVNLL